MDDRDFDDKSRARRDLLQVAGTDFAISRGHPEPFGASIKRGGINFAIFSKRATHVTLVVFPPDSDESILEVPLDPRVNRTGDVWHVFVQGLDPGVAYGFRMDMKPNPRPEVNRFNPDQPLLDPYSKALTGGGAWAETLHLRSLGENHLHRHSLVVDDDAFDWGQDQPLNIPLADSIIYELHVRGFTQHPSSKAANPGTFRGIIEKIPYLQRLGVTAVELMPVTEFEERDNPRVNPFTGQRVLNFWGYDPISFFAPKASYSSMTGNSSQVGEFKEMVKALHEAGIEVILDMVFNHTGEGDVRGPTWCFRGIDNLAYYIIDPVSGRYHNYSGCGNTLNCNHPVVRDMILDSLRYWVTEMHVDGFRFDLASILSRGRDGSPLADPPLLERIAADPVLADTKLIAEAWDAAGLYQVGSFPNWGRWAEWNGRFRDDLRRFVKGEEGMVEALALRLLGSPDLYHGDGRLPHHSINFVTAHDGFTLADLVAYNHKRNQANGEGNRDGSDANYSWNCGQEGPSSSPAVIALRRRQVRNLAVLQMFSQGVPMLLAGDEMGRTQQGNNNAYCQDNEISWLDWGLLEKNADLFRFFRRLIEYRRRNPLLRVPRFEHDSDEIEASWHGAKRFRPDWTHHSHSLALHLIGKRWRRDVYLAANAHWEPHSFELPAPRHEPLAWHRLVDTFLDPPHDIADRGQAARLQDQEHYQVEPRSVVVLVSRPED